MPSPPSHIGFAWLFHLFNKRLDVVALALGSVIPDLEIPVFLVLTGGDGSRGVLHSLAGGMIFGLPLIMVVGNQLVPKLDWPRISKVLNRVLGPLKLEVDLRHLKGYRFTGLISVFSAALGVVTHVIADSFMGHNLSVLFMRGGGSIDYSLLEGTPVLYPFSDTGFLFLIGGNPHLSSLVVNGLGLILFLYLMGKIQSDSGFKIEYE